VLKLPVVLNPQVMGGLSAAGATVRPIVVRALGEGAPDFVVEVQVGDETGRFAVELKRRSPYPHEVERLNPVRDRLRRWGAPLLQVPRISEGQANALVAHGWSWADHFGNFDLRTGHIVLRNWTRHTGSTQRLSGRSLPYGRAGLRVVRTLILGTVGAEVHTSSLAACSNTSPPRTSQVLRQLQQAGPVKKRSQNWDVDREALLELFLEEYPGPGGDASYFYTLDLLQTAQDLAAGVEPSTAVSGDLAADLLAPYRRPTHLIVYFRDGSLVEGDRLIPAENVEDANVITIRPWDTSVFPVNSKVVESAGALPLADPTQVAWDLKRLGGSDRVEHLERLKTWILKSP
jgi:hypothetical protein